QQRRADPRQAVGLDDGHGVSSLDARATGGSCRCMSCFLFRVQGLKALAAGQGAKTNGRWPPNPVAARAARAPGFHTAELTRGAGTLAAAASGGIVSVSVRLRPEVP